MSEKHLEVHDVESLRPHYARTLEAWSGNFERHLAAATAASSESAWRASGASTWPAARNALRAGLDLDLPDPGFQARQARANRGFR
jgi:hypothetical protein